MEESISHREVRFLMTTPTSAQRIFQYKFAEAVFLSGWGFILIGSPMLVAYGIVVNANWYYYILILPLMVAFTYIPTGLGAIVCLAVVHFFAPLRRPIVAASAVTVLGVIAWGLWTVFFSRQNELLTPEWFEETMVRLSTAENRLFPSWWLCSGLLEAARTENGSLEYQSWAQAILFFALLVSNAMFLQLFAGMLAGKILFLSYNRLQTATRNRRAVGLRWLDAWIAKILFISPAAMRLLLIKDFRVVRRDPLQWAQFLIFFGLVGLYFLNIKSIQDAAPFAGWVNLVSFLNLLVVGLILSTFTTRFIFPMISLEGQKFWILGLLPIERETILRGKFLFASIGTFIPSSLLILLSDSLLQLPTTILAVHEAVCLLLCTGLGCDCSRTRRLYPEFEGHQPLKNRIGIWRNVESGNQCRLYYFHRRHRRRAVSSRCPCTTRTLLRILLDTKYTNSHAYWLSDCRCDQLLDHLLHAENWLPSLSANGILAAAALTEIQRAKRHERCNAQSNAPQISGGRLPSNRVRHVHRL